MQMVNNTLHEVNNGFEARPGAVNIDGKIIGLLNNPLWRSCERAAYVRQCYVKDDIQGAYVGLQQPSY
jgi:hypothetical protein